LDILASSPARPASELKPFSHVLPEASCSICCWCASSVIFSFSHSARAAFVASLCSLVAEPNLLLTRSRSSTCSSGLEMCFTVTLRL